MIRKILLTAGVAGVFSFAAAAAAQDSAVPSPLLTPPMAGQMTPQAGTFVPGAPVVGSDGATLGVVDRVHVGVTGEQMLHVRAADGTVKAVSTTGASVRNGTVAVAWTEAQFGAAVAVPEPVDEAMPMPAPLPAPTSSDPETESDANDPPIDP